MGGFCSCFHVPDDDSTSVNCSCVGCFFQKLKNNHGNRYTQAAQTKDVVPPPNQQASASRPHGPLQVQPEPAVGQSDVAVGTIALQEVRQLLYPDPMGPPQLQRLKSCPKDGYRDTDEECPTCLVEYTPENPKIMTKCSHHYHLSCIYEWMERNENCPACGKLMLFDE